MYYFNTEHDIKHAEKIISFSVINSALARISGDIKSP